MLKIYYFLKIAKTQTKIKAVFPFLFFFKNHGNSVRVIEVNVTDVSDYELLDIL